MKGMTTEPTVVAPAASVPTAPHKNFNGLLITLGVLVLISIVVTLTWLYGGSKPVKDDVTFRMIESEQTVWYKLSSDGTTFAPADAPAWFTDAPANLLAEGDFSPAVAESGAVVMLSANGLETVAQGSDRTALIERAGTEWSSSAVGADASLAVLFNSVTNKFDVFSLDSVRPTVLSYEGSIDAPALFYGVATLPGNRVIINTTGSTFDLYTVKGGTATHNGELTLEGASAEGASSFFDIPKAHAWTYGTPLSATGATSVASTRCTGAVVASVGYASGDGAMPSIQTMGWNYMGAQGSLPANYNNGTYCIQAETALIYDESGGLNFNLIPKVYAGPVGGGGVGTAIGWEVYFTIHSGATTASAGNRYAALTYTGAAAPASVTLSASPATIDQGSATLLTWNGTSVTSCTGTGFSTGGTISGSVSVSPTTNTTYSVSCTGTGSPSQSATVTVLTRPNLSVTSISPGAVVTTVPSEISATVQNTGAASVASGNSIIFQRSSSAYGTSPVTISTQTTGSTLAAGSGTENVYASYTFPTGITYVRACADSTGAVNESNESDNCSAWTGITGTGASGSGVWTRDGSASRKVCPGGVTEMLNTCPTNTGDPNGGTCSPLGAHCSGTFSAQEADSWCDATSPIMQTVPRYTCQVPAPPAPVALTASLTPNPSTVASGVASILTWSSAGAVTCTSPDFTTGDAISGTASVSPATTTTYFLTCRTSSGGGTGTWAFNYEDNTDYSCPLSPDRIDNPHHYMDDCAASDPTGQSCTLGTSCKTNYASGCTVVSEIYECTDSGAPAEYEWVWESWWVGGTQEVFYSETIHNNDFPPGFSAEDLCIQGNQNAGGGPYDAWNQEFIFTNRVGDAGTDLAYVTCIGVNNPTGTVAKPNGEPIYRPNGIYTQTSYIRSGAQGSGGTGLSEILVQATVNVTTTECSDGISNDSDGLIDMADPGCTSTTDTSEEPNPVTATLTAPASVPYNTTANLTWACTNSTSATLTTFGSVTPVASGSRTTPALTANTSYSLTCTGASGSATDNKTVAVTNPIAYLMANPDRVNAPGSTVLSFSASGLTPASSCAVTWPSGMQVWTGASDGAGVLATTSASANNITKQTTFTLSCDSATARDTVIVNLVPEFEEF